MNTVTFEFHAGENLLECAVDYEADDGTPILGDMVCLFRGKKFWPELVFVQERDFNKRQTGKMIALDDAIKFEAFNKAQAEIDDRAADEADHICDERSAA